MAKKYDGSQQRGQGRPKTAADIAALVIRMARENAWGYTRIKGALKNLGHKIARNTIKRILQEGGLKRWTQQFDQRPQRVSSNRGFVEGDRSVLERRPPGPCG